MSSQKKSNVYVQSLNLVERFASYLSKEKSDGNNVDISKVVSYISHFSTALEYSEAVKKIFDNHIEKLDLSLTEFDSTQAIEDFEKEIGEINKQELLQNSEKYQELIKLTLIPVNGTDDEIVAVSQNINNIDPITKLPILEPVKNIKCGHIYEKNSIMSLIKMNPKTKCPIAGCAASDWVQAKDLVSDYACKRLCSDKEAKNNQKKIKM